MKNKPLYKRIFRLIRDIVTLREIRISLSSRLVVKELNDAIKKTGKPVIIYVSWFNFNYRLVQRPHHMLRILADSGYPTLAFFDSKKLKKDRENLFLTPLKLFDRLVDGKFDKILYFSQSAPIREWKVDKNTVTFYELIDDLHLVQNKEDIPKIIAMFNKISNYPNAWTMVSADRLREKAIEYGAPADRLVISKNAVNPNDFLAKKHDVPEIMKHILSKNKPIIGYYGALTVLWFDFDLMFKLICNHPEWEFVFIGAIYGCDKSKHQTKKILNKLEQYSNFTYIPPIAYEDIPNYAQHFSVATIPFQINEITMGTNPVKLFEYMAMGLPIVTTPMPECKLYKSVIIAENAEEFAKSVKKCILMKSDMEYQKLLAKETHENTWSSRVDDMVRIIEDNLKG